MTLFSKRNNDVKVTVFTKEISKQLLLDLDKYNSQYPIIEVKEFNQSHDRFLIIDNQKNLEFGFLDDRSVPFSSESGFQTLRHKEVYHFGASLKDLGKKWFAFSKFDKEVFNLMERLGLK